MLSADPNFAMMTMLIIDPDPVRMKLRTLSHYPSLEQAGIEARTGCHSDLQEDDVAATETDMFSPRQRREEMCGPKHRTDRFAANMTEER